MARLAIFVDGGYVDALANRQFSAGADYEKLAGLITSVVAGATAETPGPASEPSTTRLPPISRIPPPAMSGSGTLDSVRFATRSPASLDSRCAWDGFSGRGRGPTAASSSHRSRSTCCWDWTSPCSAASNRSHTPRLWAGDGDLVPAVQAAKLEGVSVWLFHGPADARGSGQSTYSRELWLAADDRSEIDRAFWDQIRR